MSSKLAGGVAAFAMLLAAGEAAAQQRTLNLFNWGNYTPQAMLDKFEEETGIRVTVTDYDSNDTALTRIQQGGHGFDIVVPSASYMQIYIQQGLLLDADLASLPNFGNIDPQWVDVDWDPGRRFSVPWQWGTTGVAVNTSAYDGDVNTSAIWLDPPEELRGRINVVPEMSDVMALAIFYAGGEACTSDRDILRQVRDTLMAAREHWISMDYGMIEKLIANDVMGGVNWNGSTMRARLENPDVVYGYPREGYPIWMDSAAILADANNVEEAREFLNFIMEPENAAMITEFARYSSGIMGVEAFLSEEMRTAPEIVVPDEFAAAGRFLPACEAEVQQIYAQIWTELLR
ncbi:MAG: extracellular solute-binding protein [Rhodobacteraceae bacterium]|nr:MAG: extracellular solute-binding protein [Paracoccaceae bacterium]